MGSQTGHLYVIDTPTAVDCGPRDVRLRRSFRSLVECMVPCCGFHPSYSLSHDVDGVTSSAPLSTVTGTLFGYRKGRVSFCVQDHKRSAPLLLLDLGVATAYLAREMEQGLLRIALECDRRRASCTSSMASLHDVPAWSMYCNGRRVGYAVRRQVSPGDAAVLKLMQSVSAGAGVLPVGTKSEGELMYLRATFQRVVGSPDSESFHMLSPAGSAAQELSVFLLRS